MNQHNSQGWLTTEWYTAAQFAEMQLPGLPKHANKMNRLIKKEGWAARVDRMGVSLARKRQGRGGGFEYHIELLPTTARRLLMEKLAPESRKPHISKTTKSDTSLWNWFDQQPPLVKIEARRRLKIVEDVLLSCQQGQTKTAAIASSAAHFSVSASTIWSWLRNIYGCSEGDFLPHLAARRPLSKSEVRELPDLATLHHELINVSHQLAMLSLQVAKLEKRISANETEH